MLLSKGLMEHVLSSSSGYEDYGLLPGYMGPFSYDGRNDKRKLSVVYLNAGKNFLHYTRLEKHKDRH